MVRVSEDFDVAVGRVIVLKPVLGMIRRESQGLSNFLVHDNVDLDTTLGSGEEHLVKPVLFVLRWWSAQIELRGKPPV